MKNPHISDEIYFGLNLSNLVMTQFKSFDPYQLTGFSEPTDEFKAFIKAKLKLQRIHSLKDVKDVLFFYVNDRMYNQLFKEISFQIDGLSSSEYEEHLNSLEKPFEYKRHQLVKLYHNELGAKGIFAYDISEYVKLTRLCGVCGYLSETEVRNRVLDVAQQVKTDFSSWSDFNKRVIIGDQFANAYGQQSNYIISPDNYLQKSYMDQFNNAENLQDLFSDMPLFTEA